MTEDVRFYSARRAYEFPVDGLRLTIMTAFQAQIQEAFSFQASQVGTPAATFGEVPATLPPGLAFTGGAHHVAGALPIPIRFLHVEARRIVIDVAADTAGIDPVYERLRALFEGLQAADGSPIMGQPNRTLDASEIGMRFSVDLDQLLPQPVREALRLLLGNLSSDRVAHLVPSVRVWGEPSAEQYGQQMPSFPLFHLEPRAGGHTEDRLLYSHAPLPTGDHVAYLRALSQALSESTEE